MSQHAPTSDRPSRAPASRPRGTTGGVARFASTVPLTPFRVLVGIGVLYALAQVVFVGLSQPWRWDEAVYLSQVDPNTPATFFHAHRARGSTIVAWPLAQFGAPLELTRLYLVALSSTALVLAFRPWVRAAGWAGTAAAAVTATGWVFVYFGPELYPNLLAAYGVAATAGYALVWIRDRHRGDLVALAVALALVALLRPSESVWIAAAVTPVVLFRAGRDRWRGIGALLLGGFLGWLPWLFEAMVRFGGPFARLSEGAGSSVAGQSRNQLFQYLNLTEGPVRLVTTDPTLTVRSLLLLLLLGALAGLGVAQRRDTRARQAAVHGLWAGTVLLLPYLLLSTGVNLRYLLPALALYAVPIGGGVVAIALAVRRATDPKPAVVAAVVAVAVVGWQAALAAANADETAPLQERPLVLAAALEEVADDRPCAFLSSSSMPQVQYYSGCLGEQLSMASPTLQCPGAPVDMSALAAAGHAVFVIDRAEPPADAPHADWPVVAEPDTPGPWRIWERPDDLGPDDPPFPAAPEDAPHPCRTGRAPDASDARLRLVWSRHG